MLDAAQWGLPVREYTDAGDIIADAAARRAKFFPTGRVAQKVEKAPAPAPVWSAQTVVKDHVSPEKWTAEEDAKLIALAAANTNGYDIIPLIEGRSKGAIDKRADRLGLKISFTKTVRAKTGPKPPAPEILIDQNGFRDWLNLSDPEMIRPGSARLILTIVGERTGFTLLDLTSDRKPAKLSLARQVACWLMRRHTSLSTPEIGRRIGGRDHSTVHHACQKVEAHRKTNTEFATFLDQLSAEVTAKVAP